MRKSLQMLVGDIREKARLSYSRTDTRAIAKTLVADGTFSMVLYRLMQGARDLGSAPLEMVFNKLNSTFGGCVIGRGAEFGPGFVLFHSNGVVINGKVRAGENVHVQHQVTIGDDLQGRSPVLGSNIHIGAGAKIFGPIAVGDGARIGANAVVVHDVAPDTTVVGVPAKPVRRRERDGASTKSNGAA
jgi:serine O-acetyltransferase